MIGLAASLVLLNVPLKLDLKLDDQWSYRLEQSFHPADSKEPEDEERFTYLFRIRVSGVKTDEYDWESSSRLVKHRFGGEDLPGVQGTPDHLEKLLVRRDGLRTVTVERFAPASEFRLSRLLWVGFPTDPLAESWSASWPMVENHWATAAETSFKRIGKTVRLGRTCVLIQTRFSDQDSAAPMSASGRMEVDEQTGILLAADIKAKNAPLPGAEDPRTLHVKLEATELKLRKR